VYNVEMRRKRTNITGRYRIVNEAFLRERANREFDPRCKFYQAMLSNETYDTYLAAVADNNVRVQFWRSGPITGRGEILYARRNGWIADEPLKRFTLSADDS
jgi:hypothetical protein